MPIYEFYCSDCHRVFSFLSRRVDTEKRPPCPRCSRPELARRVSAFAISRGLKEPAAKPEPDPLSGVDEARLERAMESLASEAEGIDENDPRQAGRLMRRLFEATGLPMGKQMQEALKRLESGEDEEKIEAELGDLLEQEDPFSALGGEKRDPEQSKALGALRRALPPVVDSTLYEM